MTIENTASNSPEVQQLIEAFDKTGITWHDRAATLAAFKEQAEIYQKEDGELYTYFQGKEMPLHEGLVKHALGNRVEVDARTLPKNTVDSKENYTSVRSRCDFIAKFGEDAWAKLPAKSEVIPFEIKDQSDWRKLALSEKTRLLNEDPDFNAKLPQRQSENFVAGAYINRAALEKQAKIRPGGKL